jgi:hypothetical protein
MLVRPSPSASADGLVDRTIKVLFEAESGLELPAVLAATSVKDPIADADNVSDMVADVPAGLTVTPDAVMAAGLKAGRNEKLAPVRLMPVTWKLLTLPPCKADFGLMDVITGICSTVKLAEEVTVDEPTVTVIVPVVAPEGTLTVRLSVVAAVTVAGVPLNLTTFPPGVVLKFWPWMVTEVPIAPCWGVKFRMASVFAPAVVERVTETILPTES